MFGVTDHERLSHQQIFLRPGADVTDRYTLQLQIFAEAEEDVRRLFDAQPTAEGSWTWFQVLAETTLHDGEVAWVAVLRRDGEAAAALPVATRGSLMRSLCAPYTTCYRPALGNAGGPLGSHLAKTIRYRLDLDALDVEDPEMSCFLRGLGHGGLSTADYAHFANWYDYISDFGAYWQSRESRLRATVQRKTARLERTGRLAFEEVDLVRDAAHGFGLYQNIYEESWKQPEADPGFMPALFRLMGPTGQLRMGTVRIDGEPAAVQLWFVQKQTATIFKLAHRSKFDEHSPGTLLTNWLLRNFVERDSAKMIDFGRGDDPYKKLWLGKRRQRRGLVGFNTGTPSGLYGAFRELVPTRIAKWRATRKAEVSRT
jgi:CelD/BcsL family acetyltransferase involved in cellulose biosynthesis